MLCKVFLLFSVYLLRASGELLYTIYRSADEPENLQLKIDGSIRLPIPKLNAGSEQTIGIKQFRAASAEHSTPNQKYALVRAGPKRYKSLRDDLMSEKDSRSTESVVDRSADSEDEGSADTLALPYDPEPVTGQAGHYRPRAFEEYSSNESKLELDRQIDMLLKELREGNNVDANIHVDVMLHNDTGVLDGATPRPGFPIFSKYQLQLRNHTSDFAEKPTNGQIYSFHPKFELLEKSTKTTHAPTTRYRQGTAAETIKSSHEESHRRNSTEHLVLRIATKAVDKVKPHKVQDDRKIKRFSEHVYRQAMQTFENMKKKTDAYTNEKINVLSDIYKEKYKDFVERTRQTHIKTRQGTQNVVQHIIDTSNLIMERILNFLKADMIESAPNALRQGSVSRLQKEMDTLRTAEAEHACKTFGVCSSSRGFRSELQHIISTLLSVSDAKLLQANDAATELLKNSDISLFIDSNPMQHRLKKAIKHQEKIDVSSLRSNLAILFGVLSKSRLPLVVEKGAFNTPPVLRTVTTRSLLDYLDEALPPNEHNKEEWDGIRQKLHRWRDGEARGIQECFIMLYNTMKEAMNIYDGADKIRESIKDIARSFKDEE